MKPYKFIKIGDNWYIDLPKYLAQGGTLGDLQMVDGADTMLELMAANENTIVLNISEEPFAGSDLLKLTEKCDPYIGGGYYLMKEYEGREINQMM